MKKNKLIFLTIFCLLATSLLLGLPSLVHSTVAADYIYTPTPEANGNIYYIVKKGDTCDSISLLYGVPLDELRNYNQLNVGDCDSLTIGRKLLIGVVPTAVITAGPSPTPTPLPTAAPPTGLGSVCIYLFNDINGNAIAETGESSIGGGQISIANSDANYSNTGTTTADDTPVCFSELAEGKYTISVAIPEGYNATTTQNYVINLKAGDTATVNFGAQESSHMNNSSGSGGSILLAVLGGIVLLAGMGIGVYAYLTNRKS